MPYVSQHRWPRPGICPTRVNTIGRGLEYALRESTPLAEAWNIPYTRLEYSLHESTPLAEGWNIPSARAAGRPRVRRASLPSRRSPPRSPPPLTSSSVGGPSPWGCGRCPRGTRSGPGSPTGTTPATTCPSPWTSASTVGLSVYHMTKSLFI
eukprot:1195710-Prorocentrum_minimum.AAC.3